jgi:hypothetical protein
MMAVEVALRAEVARDPLVAAILAKFPGSRVVDVKDGTPGLPLVAPDTDETAESE